MLTDLDNVFSPALVVLSLTVAKFAEFKFVVTKILGRESSMLTRLSLKSLGEILPELLSGRTLLMLSTS